MFESKLWTASPSCHTARTHVATQGELHSNTGPDPTYLTANKLAAASECDFFTAFTDGPAPTATA